MIICQNKGSKWENKRMDNKLKKKRRFYNNTKKNFNNLNKVDALTIIDNINLGVKLTANSFDQILKRHKI